MNSEINDHGGTPYVLSGAERAAVFSAIGLPKPIKSEEQADGSVLHTLPALIARFDDEAVPLTPGLIVALENLMREEMAMMRSRDAAYAECWTWGECTIADLASASGLFFYFGGDDERPDGMAGDVRIVCLAPTSLGQAPDQEANP